MPARPKDRRYGREVAQHKSKVLEAYLPLFVSQYTAEFMRLQAAQEHAASVSIARSLDALTLPQVVVKGHINVVLEKAERVSIEADGRRV